MNLGLGDDARPPASAALVTIALSKEPAVRMSVGRRSSQTMSTMFGGRGSRHPGTLP
jgi:hypothetical protein